MLWRKRITFIVSLLPLLFLVQAVVTNTLGPDPGKEFVLSLGFWAITFLWLTLAISPLKRLTGKSEWLRYRRMLGLYCWFYASLHLMSVAHFLLGWSPAIFVEEFSERPYMALGIIAWCLLVPLGVTSNRWMITRLGKYWRRLHQLVYVIALCVMLHFWWLVRSDYSEVLVFAFVLIALLGERLWLQIKRFRLS
ncbi:MAG: sulfoxide reductase heme-binding subunit YedZ [Pseudohongiellaceae bacterium]|jgi:sulfoxide reductase heme-binding subunit YedZ